jgi:hypothetical protein
MPITVPSSPPENPKCDVLGSTSIYVTWSPPNKDGQNGKIRGYKVSYSSDEDYHERQPTMATTTNQYFTIDNARKYTNYSITVVAFTSVGDGMKTKSFNCITHEDGELEKSLKSSRKSRFTSKGRKTISFLLRVFIKYLRMNVNIPFCFFNQS